MPPGPKSSRSRKAGLRVSYGLDHRCRSGDGEAWKLLRPIEKGGLLAWTFEYITWGGEFRREFLGNVTSCLAAVLALC